MEHPENTNELSVIQLLKWSTLYALNGFVASPKSPGGSSLVTSSTTYVRASIDVSERA
jgi:hypothetical protein